MGKVLSTTGDSSGLNDLSLSPEGRFTSENDEESSPGNTSGYYSRKPLIRKNTNSPPVIFVLGGPGSGKITHCDRAVQERVGLAHVNMTDLIQQHIVGNSLTDFNQMPAKTLIEVLMMELKMAVTASAYLISGYPRSMRDVVEYNEKVQRVDHVILLNWHVKILEKQIEFGAQLGDTVLQLARMELKNYTKNVLSVAEYFDQLKILTVVDGERQPSEVYDDFIAKIDSILNKVKENRRKGRNISMNHNSLISDSRHLKSSHSQSKLYDNNNRTTDLEAIPQSNNSSANNFNKNCQIVFLIGGPGCNKAYLVTRFIEENDELNSASFLHHISVGQELRNVMNTNSSLKNDLQDGELASNELVVDLILDGIKRFLKLLGDAPSIKEIVFIIDGFPRNPRQLKMFEEKVQNYETQKQPPCVLIDCSEVELGRSLGHRMASNRKIRNEDSNSIIRTDDFNPKAIKRRFEIYRITTLPTLKKLDDQRRLHIIDGDSDKTVVHREFDRVMSDLISPKEKNKKLLKPNNIKSNNHRKPSTDTIEKMFIEVDEMRGERD